jgi:hypothetical protein
MSVAITSTPPYVLTAWCLVKHKDNFTLTFPMPLEMKHMGGGNGLSIMRSFHTLLLRMHKQISCLNNIIVRTILSVAM